MAALQKSVTFFATVLLLATPGESFADDASGDDDEESNDRAFERTPSADLPFFDCIQPRPPRNHQIRRRDRRQHSARSGADQDPEDGALLAEMSGSCDPDDVIQTVRKYLVAVEKCYLQHLEKRPGLSGRVVLQWKIDPDGTPSDVTVDETTLDVDEAEECMLRQLEHTQFSEPRGDTCTVTYPFEFTPIAPHIRTAEQARSRHSAASGN